MTVKKPLVFVVSLSIRSRSEIDGCFYHDGFLLLPKFVILSHIVSECLQVVSPMPAPEAVMSVYCADAVKAPKPLLT